MLFMTACRRMGGTYTRTRTLKVVNVYVNEKKSVRMPGGKKAPPPTNFVLQLLLQKEFDIKAF